MRLGKINQWTNPKEEVIFKSIKLKPMQIAIIKCNKDNNVIVNLPTGYGKSLLFQYPAAQLKDKCVIVFVPLKALLWDCLKEAELLKISAEELTSAFIRKYQKDSKLPQLFFLTPQRLFSTGNGVLSFMDMLYYLDLIELVVIDQAHCISEWGSDFRPDYSKLCELKTMFPKIRLLGMSATIPPEAREDLISVLKIPGSYYFQSSSNRTNLIYQIKTVEKSHISSEIISYLRFKLLQGQPGIIYCQTIKSAEEIFEELQKHHFGCCLFHSKLTQKTRSDNFDKFMNEQIKVIVATICFGMGVNKKNIKFVINVGVSLSAENYYQESGRAGRDGEVAYCLLLSYKSDVRPLEFLITQSTKKQKLKRRRIDKLFQIKNYTKTEQCRKKHLFALLGEDFTPEQCKKTCDFCLEGLKTEYQEIDYTESALKVMTELAEMRVKMTKKQLTDLLKGKNVNMADKVVKEKVKVMSGMLKQQKEETIEKLIQVLIQEKMLVRTYVTLGKYKNKVQYLLPCTLVQVKKKKSIKIKMAKAKQSDLKLDITKKQPQFQKASSFMPQKFQKYLKGKGKSISISSSFDQKMLEKNQQPSKNILVEPPKPAPVQPEIDDGDELKQINMIPMPVNYEHFFDELFGEELQQKILQETQEEKGEKDTNEVNLRKSEFETFEEEELEHAICQPPRTVSPKKQEILVNNDQDSLDLELIEKIRKKKNEFIENKKKEEQNRAVVRRKPTKIDFL